MMPTTLTLPRLIRFGLLVVMLGCLFGIVMRGEEDTEGCDPDNPTEVCVYVYFPPDGWCHWIERDSPLWNFLNCGQVVGMASAMVAQSVETVADFGDAKIITVRRRYADGTIETFDRFVPVRRGSR